MGRVGGEQLIGLQDRPYDGDPHTTAVPGVRSRGRRSRGRRSASGPTPTSAAIGLDLTFTARTQPYGLRRGTMRAGDDLVWDQSHILQSGTLHRHVHRRRHHPRGRRLDRPARPLVGHPRPRPLPAVDVVPDPARRRLPRRVALGAAERRPRLHRRLLGRRRRQRPDPGGRLPPRRRAGSAPTARRPTTASTARRSPGCGGTCAFTLADGRTHRRSRPRAPSPARTSRSTGAGST